VPGHLPLVVGLDRHGGDQTGMTSCLLQLSPKQIERLDDLTAATGDHHNEQQMRMIER
jgi:hypothetical protein